MGRDRDEVFLFAAIQSEAGTKILQERNIAVSELTTVYLLEEEQLYDHSTAVLRIARRLPLLWRLAYGLMIIPKFIRDPIYKFIARNRYKWFGKRETCRIPTESERNRFLN